MFLRWWSSILKVTLNVPSSFQIMNCANTTGNNIHNPVVQAYQLIMYWNWHDHEDLNYLCKNEIHCPIVQVPSLTNTSCDYTTSHKSSILILSIFIHVQFVLWFTVSSSPHWYLLFHCKEIFTDLQIHYKHNESSSTSTQHILYLHNDWFILQRHKHILL